HPPISVPGSCCVRGAGPDGCCSPYERILLRAMARRPPSCCGRQVAKGLRYSHFLVSAARTDRVAVSSRSRVWTTRAGSISSRACIGKTTLAREERESGRFLVQSNQTTCQRAGCTQVSGFRMAWNLELHDHVQQRRPYVGHTTT